jgi:vacuolar-type H+-ATPase subunit B/Vma2
MYNTRENIVLIRYEQVKLPFDLDIHGYSRAILGAKHNNIRFYIDQLATTEALAQASSLTSRYNKTTYIRVMIPTIYKTPGRKVNNRNRYHKGIKNIKITPHLEAQQALDHQPEFRLSSSHCYPRTATSNHPHFQA